MKLAIFDIDGTLTQTMIVTDALFALAVREVVLLENFSQDWSKYPHVTDSGILQHIFKQNFDREPAEDELRAIQSRYLELLRAACPKALPVPGAADALRAIRESGEWSAAIATGNWYEAARHKLKICDLPFFNIPMATADDFSDRKEIVSFAIRKAGSPDKVVYLGDRPWDRAAATALGISFVAIGTEVPDAPLQLQDYSDLTRLWDVLEQATS